MEHCWKSSAKFKVAIFLCSEIPTLKVPIVKVPMVPVYWTKSSSNVPTSSLPAYENYVECDLDGGSKGWVRGGMRPVRLDMIRSGMLRLGQIRTGKVGKRFGGGRVKG
jgi:hypothetical protein